MIDREQLALRKASIVKGMRLQSDCPITTIVRTETPLEEASRRLTKARDMAEQLLKTMRGSRH